MRRFGHSKPELSIVPAQNAKFCVSTIFGSECSPNFSKKIAKTKHPLWRSGNYFPLRDKG